MAAPFEGPRHFCGRASLHMHTRASTSPEPRDRSMQITSVLAPLHWPPGAHLAPAPSANFSRPTQLQGVGVKSILTG